MKILFVLENYLPHIGGVEVVFRNLCEGLARQGHSVDIVTHRLKGTALDETINGVKVHRVRVPPFASRYFFTFFSIPLVLRLAKEADLIHTTSFNGAPPAYLAAKLKRKPCVITVHEVWIGKWKEYADMNGFSCIIHDLLERAIYSLKYDAYACVSDSTRKNLVKAVGREDKAFVVYNGLDYSTFYGKKVTEDYRRKLGLSEDFVLFASGRPGVSKGFEYLINAMPQIVQKIPKAKLVLILSKDPAYAKRYKMMLELIEKLGIKDKVMVLDPVPYKELPSHISMADCVVVPSITEGFGYTTAEACAMDKPVVASNTTSIPEVISGRYVLVEPKSHEAIAIGVEMVHKKQYEMTPKKMFTIEENIKGYLEIYNRLLK